MTLIAQAEKLEREMSADALWRGAVEMFASFGMPCVIYLMTDRARTSVEVKTNVPEIYRDVDPAHDPFLDYCCSSYEATRTGVAYIEQHDYLSGEAKAFITAAEHVGFRTGIGIPARLDGSIRFGGFNLGTPLDVDEFEDRFLPHLEEIRGVCLILHRRFEEVSALNGKAISLLSPREREVIELVASGASRKDCARVTGLSPNTVAEYTKSAYRKLGVHNRAEAAALLRS